jgi:hypothetical protein
MSHAFRQSMAAIAAMLALVALPATAARSSEEWSYRVQPGDTLLTLSDTLLEPERSWRDLQRLNRVPDPLKLQPGARLRMPLAWLRREATVARVLHVQGEVRLSRPGVSATAGPLAAGSELRAGDTLETGRQGSISLRFADGSRLLLSPGSRIDIEELLVHGRSAIPSTRLRLHEGNVENRVQPNAAQPPRYEIRSPHLNLGVRGTEFRVQADAAGSRAQVLEGRVAMDQGKAELPLAAGFGIAVAPGQVADKAQPLLPAPTLAGVAGRLERLPPQLAWPALTGAQRYRAQVFAAGAGDERLVAEALVAAPMAQWPELPDGSYRLRLRGIDAQGLEGRSAETGFVLKARPEPPFLQSPAADGVVYGSEARIAWTRALAARHYRLQVADSADFAAPLRADRERVQSNEAELALPPGRYFWRVASVAATADGSDDPGPFSDTQSFTLRAQPPSPEAMPPELGDRLRLRWRAVPDMRYQLQLAGDVEFSSGLRQWDSAEATLELDRPPPGTYYLRLRSIDAHGHAGPWGGVQQIDIPHPRWLWLLMLLPLLGL